MIPKIAIDSVEIPERFVTLASRWYGGQGDMLYAVCSTGGLTTGDRRPVYDGRIVSDEVWYWLLWSELVDCIESARESCAMLLEHSDRTGGDGYDNLDADMQALDEFADFADGIAQAIYEDYDVDCWLNEE
jgi:hypothetical protein